MDENEIVVPIAGSITDAKIAYPAKTTVQYFWKLQFNTP